MHRRRVVKLDDELLSSHALFSRSLVSLLPPRSLTDPVRFHSGAIIVHNSVSKLTTREYINSLRALLSEDFVISGFKLGNANTSDDVTTIIVEVSCRVLLTVSVDCRLF